MKKALAVILPLATVLCATVCQAEDTETAPTAAPTVSSESDAGTTTDESAKTAEQADTASADEADASAQE